MRMAILFLERKMRGPRSCQSLDQARHGYFQPGNTPVQGQDLIGEVFGVDYRTAEHDTASEFRDGASSVAAASAPQFLEFFVRHPKVNEPASNFQHGDSRRMGLQDLRIRWR